MKDKPTMRAAICPAICLLVGIQMNSALADLSETIDFNIKPQTLQEALIKYSAQSGVQITSPADIIEGKSSLGVMGNLPARNALARLLEGTELTYAAINENTVTIQIVGFDKSRRTSAAQEGEASLLWNRLAQLNPAAGEGQSANSTAASSTERVDLEEVIVTAQKREERLQDVPISIGVLSGQELDRGSSRGVIDALSQIGGVSVTEGQPGNTFISIRGVVGGVASSPTGFYLDEVPLAFVRNQYLPDANAFDLARVEVLRGAQGTLYGANSMGGVVRVLTNDANLDAFEVKGRLRTSHTEDAGDNYDGDMAINLPLIPGKLAVRAVAGYSDLSGFIDSTAPAPALAPGGLADGGRDINDSKARSYRVKVYAQPSEDFSVKLGLHRSDITNGADSAALDDFTTMASSNRRADYLMDTYNLIAEYDWSHLSLLSSTGYVDYTNDILFNIYLGGLRPVPSVVCLKSFSQELRLTTHLDGPWQWSLGAFYKDTSEKFTQDARAAGLVFAPLFTQVYRIAETSESYAIFGETTRSFHDGKFELTGGLRYFQDDYLQTQQSNFHPGPVAPDLPLEFEKLTWRLVATYKPQEEMSFYGSVATGFRSGIGQSPATLLSQPQFQGVVKPDSVLTYELGAKGRLFGGALTYETAVYYMKWEDIAQVLILPVAFGARVNAGTASGPGAEVTLSYQPMPALTLHTSIGWNDLGFEENIFQHVGAAAPGGTDVVLFEKDSRINGSAEWTGSVGGTFRAATPLTGIDFVLSSNFSYGSARDSRSVTGTVLTVAQSDAIDLLTARIGLEADRWSLDIYGDNLLNERGSIDARLATFLLGTRERPRTIGLQVAFDF